MVMTKQAEGIRRAKRDTGEAATKAYDIYAKAPAVVSDAEVNLGYTESQPGNKWKAYPVSGAWPTEHKNHTEAVGALIGAYGTGAKADSVQVQDAGEQVVKVEEGEPVAKAGEHVHPGTGVQSEGTEVPLGETATIESTVPVVVDVDLTQGGGQSPDGKDDTDYDRPDSDAELGIDGPGIAGEPELTADSAPVTHPVSPDVPDGEPVAQAPSIAGSEQLGDGRVAHSTVQDPAREQRIEEGEHQDQGAEVPFSHAAERDPLFPRDSAPRSAFPADPFADPFSPGGAL